MIIIKNAVNYKSFFLSLSSLLDIGDPSLTRHQLRTAFIAWNIGKEYDLDKSRMNDLIIASLIHDIGALSLEEKVDLRLSRYEDVDMHAYRGWYFLQKVPDFINVANAIKYHHSSFKKLKNSYILAQIINISDTVDRLINIDTHILEQHIDIIGSILENEDLHPKLKELFISISRPEKFWLALTNLNILSFFEEAPISTQVIHKDTMISLSFLIRDIIDFKSPFTLAHSIGVMFCAYHLGSKEGYSDSELENLALAGLLHDVGKLTVPNYIIMKPGALNSREKSLMMQHPYYTYQFLNDACYSELITFAASCHHEDLNGNGYPFKFKNQNLNDFDKIMAVCDVFVALHEDRPYRKGLSLESITRIMYEMSDKKLDRKFVSLLLEEYDELKIGLDEMLYENRMEYDAIQNSIE